jgi:iron complex outermembrane receptor protein
MRAFGYENNAFDNAMRFYSQDNGPSSPYERPDNPYFTRWDYRFQTNTVQLHAQDTVKLTEQLTANFGFKSPHTTTSVNSHNDTDNQIFCLMARLPLNEAFYLKEA